MDKELLKPKIEIGTHYEFPENKGLREIDDEVTKYVAHVEATLLDMTDREIVRATVEAAKEDGISDLYLLDREFVLSAIREKIEREQG